MASSDGLESRRWREGASTRRDAEIARLTPFANRLGRVPAGRHPIRQGFVLPFEACDGAKRPDSASPSYTVVEVRVAGTVGLGFESSRVSCCYSNSSEYEHVRY